MDPWKTRTELHLYNGSHNDEPGIPEYCTNTNSTLIRCKRISSFASTPDTVLAISCGTHAFSLGAPLLEQRDAFVIASKNLLCRVSIRGN